MAGKPLIVILGPTAVGKTRLSLQLAERLNGAIIGADSRQIYRYMNIGTAKPTPAEQARAPHHMIDVVEPNERLTLAHYQRMVYERIDALHAEGKMPLLVGGTGQYISAVTEGWSIPEVPPDDDLRAELETYAEANGVQALHHRLERIDPEAAVNIHPNNVRRVVRALEVCLIAGEKISVLQQKKPPPYRILELGLTMERQNLYERADKRVDIMIAQGLLEEVRDLLARGYSRKLPSMSGLGYAQLARHLLDGQALEEAIYETKTATHNFIRRQQTWFKGHDNGILWHNVEQTEAIIATCERWGETA